MFVNAALIRPGYPPGRYPSAGPLPHLMDVWRAGAPAIDVLSPDIYFPNFQEWAGKYHRGGNAIIIPESPHNARTGANAFWTFGQLDAIGYGPFAVDDVTDPQDSLGRAYDILNQLTPLILKHQGDGTMVGFSPMVHYDWSFDIGQKARLGDYTLNVTFDLPRGATRPATTPSDLPPGGPTNSAVPPGVPLGGGLAILLGPDELLIAGSGITITFAPAASSGEIAGILSIQEGRFDHDQWVGGRWLNGDQSHQGRHVQIPMNQFGIQIVKLYRYR
jgi:hypothetical protein